MSTCSGFPYSSVLNRIEKKLPETEASCIYIVQLCGLIHFSPTLELLIIYCSRMFSCNVSSARLFNFHLSILYAIFLQAGFWYNTFRRSSRTSCFKGPRNTRKRPSIKTRISRARKICEEVDKTWLLAGSRHNRYDCCTSMRSVSTVSGPLT